MSLFKRESSYGSSFAYTKIDKEDPEEAIHRRAQFLIYKAMEEADYINSRRTRPSFSKMRFSKVKVKIGNRLRNLRRRMMLAISVARAGTYRQMARQLKACRRLLRARQANTRLPALLI